MEPLNERDKAVLSGRIKQLTELIARKEHFIAGLGESMLRTDTLAEVATLKVELTQLTAQQR
jgi:hypothetical protein